MWEISWTLNILRVVQIMNQGLWSITTSLSPDLTRPEEFKSCLAHDMCYWHIVHSHLQTTPNTYVISKRNLRVLANNYWTTFCPLPFVSYPVVNGQLYTATFIELHYSTWSQFSLTSRTYIWSWVLIQSLRMINSFKIQNKARSLQGKLTWVSLLHASAKFTAVGRDVTRTCRAAVTYALTSAADDIASSLACLVTSSTAIDKAAVTPIAGAPRTTCVTGEKEISSYDLRLW